MSTSPATSLCSLICSCGYATPVRSRKVARTAIGLHRCDARNRGCNWRGAMPILNGLPRVAADAVTRYVDMRCNRSFLTVDPVLVDRLAAGDHRQQPNVLERVATFALMRSRGVPVNECARRLHLSWSTQSRYRQVLDAVGIAGPIEAA